MYVLCQLLQSVAALFFGKVVQYNVNVRLTASVYCLVCFCLIWVLLFFHKLMSAIFCCSLKTSGKLGGKEKIDAVDFGTILLFSSLLPSNYLYFISNHFQPCSLIVVQEKGCWFSF